MHQADIVTLNSYTFWADLRLLDTIMKLSPKEFVRIVTPDPDWYSLRGTLVHALDTAYGWRMALQGLEDRGVMGENPYADVATLQTRWKEERSAWLAYVATLTDDDLNAVWWSHADSRRTRWQTILRVVNDLTHHRSEAPAMLTGYGHSPGELDFDQVVQLVVDVVPGKG